MILILSRYFLHKISQTETTGTLDFNNYYWQFFLVRVSGFWIVETFLVDYRMTEYCWLLFGGSKINIVLNFTDLCNFVLQLSCRLFISLRLFTSFICICFAILWLSFFFFFFHVIVQNKNKVVILNFCCCCTRQYLLQSRCFILQSIFLLCSFRWKLINLINIPSHHIKLHLHMIFGQSEAVLHSLWLVITT